MVDTAFSPSDAIAVIQSPRLLDILRHTARERGHSESTVSSFVDWSERFIRFHGNWHPRELQVADVARRFGEHAAESEANLGECSSCR